jgi:hypothetical protein
MEFFQIFWSDPIFLSDVITHPSSYLRRPFRDGLTSKQKAMQLQDIYFSRIAFPSNAGKLSGRLFVMFIFERFGVGSRSVHRLPEIYH